MFVLKETIIKITQQIYVIFKQINNKYNRKYTLWLNEFFLVHFKLLILKTFLLKKRNQKSQLQKLNLIKLE